MGSSDGPKGEKRRLEDDYGRSLNDNNGDGHADKRSKIGSPRSGSPKRHSSSSSSRDKDRHRDRDRERDRDRDRDRDRRHRDKDRHKDKDRYKDRDRRDDRDRNRDRDKEREREREQEREREREREKEKEKEKESEKAKEEREKAEQEAKKKEEEQREEQERLELEEQMRKRRERVEAWRREREEELRKKKEEEEAAAAAALEAAKKKKWSLDDDDEDDDGAAGETDGVEVEEVKLVEPKVEAVTADKMQEDDDRDPLDAFMVGIDAEVKKLHHIETSQGATGTIIVKKALSTSVDGRPEPASTMDFDDDSDEEVVEAAEEEEDTQSKWKRKKMLAAVDHSKIDYAPFRKSFYIEVPEIAKMSEEEVAACRKALDDIKVRGRNCPKPIKSFTQAGLSNKILDVIKKLKFEKPTPIQAQAIPAAMSGRDVIGIAKTGSGKTLSFLLPMLRHILDQPPLLGGEGPIGLVMSPTRELAMQISSDIKPFAKACGLRCVAVYGGAGVANQIGDLKRGAEIVVCTPGRMIDMLCANSGRVVNLRRTTFVVLDEADRMFDMGFEPQIMRIIDNIRPDRQTVMFSATFPKVVETAARKILTTPLDIVVGGRSVVCGDIAQIIEVRGEETKFRRLLELLKEWYEKGNVLVFANTQESVDLVFTQLTQAGYPCLSLHGGKDQLDRDFTILEFKTKEKTLMVATSVAARGLDVKDLKLVVNYDVPNHYEDYVHRVGRTGRAGNKGTAITFITPDEERFAPDLVKALTASTSPLPSDLQNLADGFSKKKNEGQSVQTHGSGFGGKGFKFDESEEAKRQEHIKAQKKAWGIEEEEEETAVGDEEDGEGTTTTTTAAKEAAPSGPPSSIAGVTLPPGLINLNPALVTQLASAITQMQTSVGDAFTPAKEAAQQLINQLLAEVQKLPPSTPPAQKAQFVGTILSIQSAMVKPQGQGAGPGGPKVHFDGELEINDFPQQARWKVTHKDALSNITEWTGAAITTRGLYFPPGTRVPPGERKLYLYIEGPSDHSVQTAKKEIKRILDDATMGGAPDRGQMGRYQVL